jgi:hypothetical protein
MSRFQQALRKEETLLIVVGFLLEEYLETYKNCITQESKTRKTNPEITQSGYCLSVNRWLCSKNYEKRL